ncbi:zinc finger protein 335 isoform X1 [Xenopus tropicalis]|uniref:Zinc finger protein 335 isoform X1 n=1 Tax=Xenopus tropicalis TaxID=8364 RepID=A0A8J1IZC6_XENTR|nr:zinc finger protein 335 isoform X1 [Xenopus tropicalis]XP_031750100.1 zinc finger protein 335 isoform X1 [Xenopus tropicalis]
MKQLSVQEEATKPLCGNVSSAEPLQVLLKPLNTTTQMATQELDCTDIKHSYSVQGIGSCKMDRPLTESDNIQSQDKTDTRDPDLKLDVRQDHNRLGWQGLDLRHTSGNLDLHKAPINEIRDSENTQQITEQSPGNTGIQELATSETPKGMKNPISSQEDLKQNPGDMGTLELAIIQTLHNIGHAMSSSEQTVKQSPVSMEITVNLPEDIDTNSQAVSQCTLYTHNTDVTQSQDIDSQTISHSADNMDSQELNIKAVSIAAQVLNMNSKTPNSMVQSRNPNYADTQDPNKRRTLESKCIIDTFSAQSSNNAVVQETGMIQSSDHIYIQDMVARHSSNIMASPDKDIIYHSYPEKISSAPIPSIPCSVSDASNVYQSLLSEGSSSILVQSDRPATAFSTGSVDGIINAPINPQIIQGCIVANPEGSNSEITQYLILQEQDSTSSVTVASVPVGERYQTHGSSCAAESMADAESLEGMVEVVFVQQYKCKMCKYKSTSKPTLLRHVRERHIQPTSIEEKRSHEGKVARSKEEEEEEEDDDDIVDAGAIDDPNDDSDYSPGEDTPNNNLESAHGILIKERPRRKPGRPRKIPRIDGPKLDIPLSSNDNQTDQGVTNSDLENKDPASLAISEEQSPPKRMRGRPPKHIRGKKYRRFRGSRFYRPPSKRLLRPFICRICGSSFLTHDDFTFHVTSHVGNDPQAFQCQQCSYQCRRWSSLKEHMYNHKGSKPYKCEECEYTSVYKKDVVRHSAVHREDRKKKSEKTSKPASYPCPVCGRIYTMQKRLTQHMKIHSAEKPHMCDKCGKAFKKRYTFKMHLLTHLQCVGKSRYKCEFCEYICGDRKQLLNHQLTHMNDKPFKCSQCKYHTYRQDFLLSHMATKHAGGKPFACDHCHFTTKHKKNLRLHVQSRHPLLYNEWSQRHPEETPSRRRPFFSMQQIEELKQLHEQSENQGPSPQEVVMDAAELSYQILQPTSQSPTEEQSHGALGAAAIIYEQEGEEEEYATRAALDLLLNMSTRREGTGGPLQVAVVKSGSGGEVQSSQSMAHEPHMAQVLTLHVEGNGVTSVQEAGYEDAGVEDTGYEGAVQQITIDNAFTTAEYSLINTENIPASLCSETSASPGSTLLGENIKDKILRKSQQAEHVSDHSAAPAAKKFCCKLCGTTFLGRSEMEIHKRAHVPSGGFKCPDCIFTAANWPEVRNHLSVHSDRRPHRCDQCSFACKNKRDLSRHSMIHTNQRPHSCPICGQRFTRKAHLKFHIQRLHRGKNNEPQENEAELTPAPSLEEEHIFLTQEESMASQEDTAYIQEITTADGQTLQQLVTADNQVQYIISQEDIPHLIPQEYVVLPDGHHIQVQDGQITHIQYESGTPFLQDPQIHFVPMSPSQQLLTQEQLQAAAHSAVTAVADAAMAQTVFSTETEQPLPQEIEYDIITLGE